MQLYAGPRQFHKEPGSAVDGCISKRSSRKLGTEIVLLCFKADGLSQAVNGDGHDPVSARIITRGLEPTILLDTSADGPAQNPLDLDLRGGGTRSDRYRRHMPLHRGNCREERYYQENGHVLIGRRFPASSKAQRVLSDPVLSCVINLSGRSDSVKHLLMAGVIVLAVLPSDATEIVLRPDLPAGEEWYTPPADNPHRKSAEEKWVRKVQRPVLEVYPAAKPNGTAMVIAPGGGFNILAIEHEGRDVARWLNGLGVSAFVLRYRVGLETRESSQKAAIEDGLLAVKTVRERAKEWNVDPGRIGVMGFSAGGYLTVGVATQSTPDSKPDFAVPIYAVAPEGFSVPADAPPLFVAVAFDDNTRMTGSAIRLLENWKKAGVPVELHVFSDGGHGFGMNRKGKASDVWTDLLQAWMSRMKLLPRS
jgi:acetyl esterase/lipase